MIKTERQRQLCRWTTTYERHLMKEWIAVLRAADMAARWLVDQRRKGIGTCDVEGTGNVAWSRYCDTRRRKSEPTVNTNFDLNRRASARPYL
jgi:hypothetical protein